MRRCAVIDVGSNSLLLLVAEEAPGGRGRVLAERAVVTRLGEKLRQTGELAAEAMERSLEELGRFAALARSLHVDEPIAVGTACLRRARNAATFLAQAEQRHGLRIQVISGDEEARLSYLAGRSVLASSAAAGPAAGGLLAVVDVGGGSTELAIGAGPRIVERHSLELGVLRLSEERLTADPVPPAVLQQTLEELRAFLAEQLGGLPAAAAAVGVGGTFTTMAAVELGLMRYDPGRVHGARLDRAALARQLELYRAATLAERRALPGMQPGRAEVVLAGAAIAVALLERLGLPFLTVSDHGLRHALLAERCGLGVRP